MLWGPLPGANLPSNIDIYREVPLNNATSLPKISQSQAASAIVSDNLIPHWYVVATKIQLPLLSSGR